MLPALCLLASSKSPNTQSLVEGLRRAGHRVTILTFHGERDADPDVVALPRRFGKLDYVTGHRHLIGTLKRIRPQVLVGYHVTSYGVAAAATGFRPLALIAAGGDILPEQYGHALRAAVMPRLARWAIVRSQQIFSWAPHMTSRLIELGASPDHVVTLPRGVDTTWFYPAAEPATDGAAIQIVSTRALKPLYRIDVLLESVRRLGRLRAGVRTVIAGDGPERQSLMAAANAADAGEVSFVGTLESRAIAELLRQSHVYVSLTRSDGVSASLLEAMAAGLVPVVSDIPANRPWIEHGDNGLLTQADNVEAVTDALARAASDRELQARCRTKNPGIVAARGDVFTNTAIISAHLTALASRGSTNNLPTAAAAHVGR